MKYNKVQTILSCLLLSCSLAFFASCQSGCRTGSGRFNPTTGQYDTNAPADQIVVTAQSVRQTALDTFELVSQTEAQLRDTLWKVSPDIKHSVDHIRTHGIEWINSLTAMTDAYQSNRTEENKVKLDGAIAMLQAAIAEAQGYIAQGNRLGTNAPPVTPK